MMRSATFRAAIFDLDGTIADTLATIGMAVNDGLDALGMPPHPIPAYAHMVGDGVVALCERALAPSAAGRLDDLVREVMRQCTTHPLRETRLYDGMAELLDELGRRSMKLGVLSNKPHDLTVATIEGLGIDGHFQSILGQRDDLPRKPDPAGALHVLKELGVPPGEALYIGDTSTDMVTAAAAGITSCGVLWGFRDRDELLAHGANHLVAHPSEILPLLS